MYNKYLFVGACAISGGVIYNAVQNLYVKPSIYDDRKNIFNYGMLLGLSLGSGLAYLRNPERLLLKSSE